MTDLIGTIRNKLSSGLSSGDFLPIASLIAVISLVFSGALFCFFAQDDFIWLRVASNSRSISDVLNAFCHYNGSGFYRPLTQQIYFLINYKLFGLNAMAFHAGNLSVHFINSCLVYFILRSLGKKVNSSWLGALFYGVNSALFSSVYWVSAMSESGMAMFFLLALLTAIAYFKYQRRSYWFYSILFTVLALMSKESAIMIPVIMVLIYLYLNPQFSVNNSIRAFRCTYPHFFIVTTYLAVRIFTIGISTNEAYTMSFSGTTLGRYIDWAMNRSDIIMSLARANFGGELWLLSAAIGLLFYSGILFMIIRHRKETVFALLWFLLALMPVLPLVTHAEPYYLNIALVGIGFLLATALESVGEIKAGILRPVNVLVFVLIISTSVLTIRHMQANSWVTGRAMIASSSLEAVKKAYPALPRDAVIDLIDTDTDAYNAYNFGDVFKVYYYNSRLKVNFLPALSNDCFNKNHYVFQYYNGTLYDITKQKKLLSIPFKMSLLAGKTESSIDLTTSNCEEQLGKGWYPPEKAHRWMSKRAEVYLRDPGLNGDHHEIIMTGFAPLDKFSRKQLLVKLLLDDEMIYHGIIKDPGRFEIRAPFTKNLSNICYLDIILDQSFVPARLSGSADTRELGLAFNKITLK
jgi:hypothetical protein